MAIAEAQAWIRDRTFPADKPLLDRCEGLGAHYRERRVLVESPHGDRHDVWLYYAHERKIAEGLQPFDWYHALVLEGAKEHGLPADYVAEIEAISSATDPDAVRRQRELLVLGSTGATDAGR